MLNIEVERKRTVKSSDMTELMNKLAEHGFKKNNRYHEIDTYYTRRDIDYMKTVECLRVRKRDGFAELTYKPASNKNTSDSNGTIAKKETNVILKNSSQATVANHLLETIGLIKLVTVDKIRDSYTKSSDKHITIAIDSIKGVGNFIEIEIMSKDVEQAKKNLESLENKLGVSAYEVATLPYRDMVMNSKIGS